MTNEPTNDRDTPPRSDFGKRNGFAELVADFLQFLLALLPNLALYATDTRLSREPAERSSGERAKRSLAAFGFALVITLTLLFVCQILMRPVVVYLDHTGRLYAAVYMMKEEKKRPATMQPEDLQKFVGMWSMVLAYLPGVFVPRWIDRVGETNFGFFKSLMQWRFQFVRLIGKLIGAVFLLGLSLLPLSSLLLMLPAVAPQEAVLTDTVRTGQSRWQRLGRRVFAAATGIALLLVLLAFSVEVVTRLNLKSPYFGKLARMVLPDSLAIELPKAMVDQWPYVFLVIYATDLLLLFGIGKIPLNYNVRNLIVRWRITLLTGLAFTVVLCLLTAMLAFVNGLHNLTANSGIAGNVFVLSEGSTDELFSSLYKGDIEKIELENAVTDVNGYALPATVRIKEIPGPNGTGRVRLCSYETYFVINQVVPVKSGEKPRRRFVQLRGIVDSYVSAKVHNIELLEGKWFGREGGIDVGDGRTACPCVLGEGAAAKFADDLGKPKLTVGDVFKLGDLDMVVAGIMKSEGSTFGSEVWATWDRVGKAFNKKQYTTVVLRVADDSEDSAKILAKHLSVNFKNPRVRAVDEKKYFEDLGKSNDQMLTNVIIIAIIMAIGGVFGVMNTMFAAIAQRTKDIGVMRILGFKRWQILVSFMLESLGIALLGGVIGVACGALFDGIQMTSNVSSGQGGGKTVIMKLAVDADIMICGLLFTIVMGRVGGLVPALSAMRKGILESLK
jgi:putative ABC transport system permease protein